MHSKSVFQVSKNKKELINTAIFVLFSYISKEMDKFNAEFAVECFLLLFDHDLMPVATVNLYGVGFLRRIVFRGDVPV